MEVKSQDLPCKFKTFSHKSFGLSPSQVTKIATRSKSHDRLKSTTLFFINNYQQWWGKTLPFFLQDGNIFELMMFFQHSFPQQPELCMWCHNLYLVTTCCPRNNKGEMVNVAKANHGCRKVVQYKHGLMSCMICMMYTIMQLFILKLSLYQSVVVFKAHAGLSCAIHTQHNRSNLIAMPVQEKWKRVWLSRLVLFF